MAVRASWLERASGTLGRAIYEFRLPFRRAKFGQIQTARGSWFREKGKDYKVPENRLDVYTTAWDYYLEHEFARPIINLQASAIFGKGIQFVGDNAQVEFARNLFGKVDLFQYGIEGGIYGDNFVRIFGEEGEDILGGGRFNTYFSEPPRYCYHCGLSYPWTQRAIEKLDALAEEAPNLSREERAELSAAVQDIMKDTARKGDAIDIFKRLFEKAGGTFWEEAKDILARITAYCMKPGP